MSIQVELPVNINELVNIPEDVGGTDTDPINPGIEDKGSLDEEKMRVAEDIRHQIKELVRIFIDIVSVLTLSQTSPGFYVSGEQVF